MCKFLLIILLSYQAYSQPLKKLVRKQADQGQGIPGATLTYTNNFNSGDDLDPDNHGQLGDGEFSSAIKHEGANSFHSLPATVSGSWRSEVQFDESRTTSEGVITYWVYYETVVNNQCHSMQFHPNTGGGSASPGLWHTSGEFEIVNWDNGDNEHYATNESITLDTWMFFRHDFKFGANGYWKFYIDGVEKLNISGVQIGDGSGQYFKLGVNIFSGGTPASSIYYDELKIYSIP